MRKTNISPSRRAVHGALKQTEYYAGRLLWVYGPLGTMSGATDEGNSRMQQHPHPVGPCTHTGSA